jgi:hypothetical protein
MQEELVTQRTIPALERIEAGAQITAVTSIRLFTSTCAGLDLLLHRMTDDNSWSVDFPGFGH